MPNPDEEDTLGGILAPEQPIPKTALAGWLWLNLRRRLDLQQIPPIVAPRFQAHRVDRPNLRAE